MNKSRYLSGSEAKKIDGHDAMRVRLNMTKLREFIKFNQDSIQTYTDKSGDVNEVISLEIWPNRPEYQSKYATHCVKVAEPRKPQ